MSSVSSVIIKIGAQTAEAVSGIRNVDRALGDAQTTGQKFQSAIGKAALPAAAALTALGGAAILSAKAAAEDAASREQLDSQIRRSTDATLAAVTANEGFIDSMMRQTAIADDELRPAMGNLVRATGDVHEAQKLLAVSADLAAATGKPLATVSQAVAKAYDGSATSLKKLVPSLDDAAIKSGNWKKIQAELNDTVGGAAAKSAGTAAGQYKLMQIEMGELQESIGAGLLPVIETLVPMLSSMFELAQGHSGIFLVVAGAVAAFAVAILAANAAISVYTTVTTVAAAVTRLDLIAKIQSAAATVVLTAQVIAYTVAQRVAAVATKVFAAAQALLNVVLTANPIGLVVVALAALAAGLYLAYRHSATFRGIVQGAFQVARDNAILLLGPIGLIIKGFQTLWQHSSTFRQIVTGAFDAVLDSIDAVLGAIEDLVGWIGRIHFPSKPSWLPLSIPGTSSSSSSAVARSGAAAPVFNVTIHGALDPESTAIAIRRVLERYDRRRGGPLGLGAPRAV